MAKLKLRARLVHFPGPWGPAVPAAGAEVKLIDLHPLKGTKQTIWSGAANSSGVIAGTSSEWQDQTVLVPARPSHRLYPGGPVIPGAPAVTGPDPTDALMLLIEVKIGGQTSTYPFVFLGDNIEVPVVLPFGPPDFSPSSNRAVLNGTEITDLQVLFDTLVSAVQQRQDIDLRLYGPWSDAAGPIVDVIRDTPLKRARRVFPLSRPGSLEIVVGGVTITISASFLMAAATLVLAIAAVILMTGAAVFVTCLGIVVILAVLSGYQTITAEQTSTTGTDGSTTNETRIRIGNVA